MKNKKLAILVAAMTILTGCSSPTLSLNEEESKVVDGYLQKEESSNSKTSDNEYDSDCDYPTGVLGIEPTKAFEEVYMPVAAIIDSYEEEECLHFFDEVEDLLDDLGYEYTYEVDAYDDYDRWIIVKDSDADAEIRIYGHYDEFANVNVSEEDIRYDLSCIEYQAGNYYGITDLPTLTNEPCKHGVDDNHEIPDSYEYVNIGWPENSITNVASTEDVRKFFFIIE